MAGRATRRRHGRRAAALLAALAFVAGLTPGVVSASEPPEQPKDEAPLRATSQTVARPRIGSASDTVSTHMWVSHRLQRAYFLRWFDPEDPEANTAPNNQGFNQLVAVDLTTGEEAGTASLPVPAYAAPGRDYRAVGAESSVVIDDAGGRILVATQSATVPPVPVATAVARAQQHALDATRGTVCARPGGWVAGDLLTGCVSGVSVLDAETLEHVRHIPLQSARVDGAPLGALLLNMTYSPATEDLGGRLHLLVQESAHGGEILAQSQQSTNTRAQSLNLTSLVQVDVDLGRQDWALRLDDCRGALAANQVAANDALFGLRHQAAMVRMAHEHEHALYVACHSVSQSQQAAVVRVPLDAEGMPPVLPVTPPAPEQVDGPVEAEPDAPASGRVTTVHGPDRVYEMLADPASGRLLLQVLDGEPKAQVWWVFDTTRGRFLGTVGIGGPTEIGLTLSAVDGGRLYVLARPYTKAGRTFEGGLYVADIWRTPVSQALHYPALAGLFPADYDTSSADERWALTVQRLQDGARRVWVPGSFSRKNLTVYRSFEDHLPSATVDEQEEYAGRTLDIPEAPGVTDVAFDGAARGYGARILMVTGAEAAVRVGPVDPVGTVEQCNDPAWGQYGAGTATADAALGTGRGAGGPCHLAGLPVTSACLRGDREIVLASVGPQGPAVVDNTGARGAANPVTVDSLTAADAEAPASRCSGQDWEQLWTMALFGRPPSGEPRADTNLGDLLVECVSSDATPADRAGDPVTGTYSAAVDCAGNEASGHAYTRGMALDGVAIAEALSSFRIYRDPGRGVVARVESVARGVSVQGVFRVDTVRGVAESWANGRRQPVAAEARESGYEPNCDMERTAGTCFRRHLFGVTAPGYHCGPCGDEAALTEGLSTALGPLGFVVHLREPDSRLRVGAENGFLAAIQKPESDRFGDLVLNNDLLQTVLPTLEIIRNAAPNRVFSRMGSRGRQIVQLAGVEVSSSYGIACLLVYDEEKGTCAPQVQEPGALRLELRDEAGAPLAGGAFEVRHDVDGDGVLGLSDTLLPNGACVTAADGVGTCDFAGLTPGAYLVAQKAAPTGYATPAEPHAVELAAGERRTVTFVNAPDVSTIEVRAADEAGGPVAGASFAAYADTDGDGKVAPDATPAATCVTGADGTCRMRVATGSWVLVQTAAPAGLALMDPVAFTFAAAGQTATVTVVNTPVAAPAAPAPAAAPTPVYDSPPAPPAPVETAEMITPRAGEVAEPPAVSPADAVGGTVVRVIRAPGDAMRLLAREPRQALAWTASVALLAAAVLAVRRRHQALVLLTQKEGAQAGK